MRIKLSEIYFGFKNKEFTIRARDLPCRDTAFRNSKVTVKLSAIEQKNQNYLRGNIKAEIEYICVRCLKKIPKNIDQPVNILILQNDLKNTTKSDLDILYVNKSSDCLDLKNLFADIIALAEPIQPLCKEQCYGLCSICGAEKPILCNCHKHTNSPAWDKLKELHF